jgi:hypothetical protein
MREGGDWLVGIWIFLWEVGEMSFDNEPREEIKITIMIKIKNDGGKG